MNSYYTDFHDKGLGFFGGFYQTSALTHTFHLFIFVITSLILELYAFCPMRGCSPIYGFLNKLVSYKLVYLNNLPIGKIFKFIYVIRNIKNMVIFVTFRYTIFYIYLF
ncbi:MAG: hypothetical protein EOP34_01165 [Rickettsiales bacterium]|nr:MAG: hypothetical protein EOP34_01165 [Rickettsiales bacterium]